MSDWRERRVKEWVESQNMAIIAILGACDNHAPIGPIADAERVVLSKFKVAPVPLPCPHCGSHDLNGPHFTEYAGDMRDPHWWIECNRCPCVMQVDGETAVPLVKAWNRRASAA